MADDIKVKLKLRGINQLMKRDALPEVVRRIKKMEAAAGEGFEAKIQSGKYTARAVLRTADEAGRKRQAEEAVLEQALDAGR